MCVLVEKCKPKHQVASKKGGLGKLQGFPKCSFKRLLLSSARKRENRAACSLIHHGRHWSLWSTIGRENLNLTLHVPQPGPDELFLSSRSAQPHVNGTDKYFLCHSLFTINFSLLPSRDFCPHIL